MNKYLLKLKDFTLDFWRSKPVKIYLFGSWARGEAQCSSDVDIAVERHGTEDLTLQIDEFREALEDSCIIYNVDVVDMNMAAESLRQRIYKEGTLWKD